MPEGIALRKEGQSLKETWIFFFYTEGGEDLEQVSGGDDRGRYNSGIQETFRDGYAWNGGK